ncbi:MAG TPA: AAA family ATPase [Gaiella sp.]|nr:AAA family ATPase [Gaiella sp.]
MLIGRESECARIDELLHRARLGRSGALVLRGEAGIGKTALLDYAAERARDATVVRALGVESEVEIEFSSLFEICRPLFAHLDELPEQQAGALRAALGLGPPLALDRYAIGAATLGLFAAAAEAQPLLVLADDGQWLDPASADAVLFATRRLEADRVVVLFAARDGDDRPFEAPGIESLRIGPLGLDHAKAVLVRRGEIDDRVAERLFEGTRGNPLALVEVLSLLTPEQLRGDEPLEEPLPVGAGVERAYARRAAELPEEARTALLVAAVSASSSLSPVIGALAELGLDAGALEPSEDAGLIDLADGRLTFRHPLVRSAVYQAAAASERRAAHRALADAWCDAGPEERAWHLAAAALGPDEDVAAALEFAAGEARRRSGFAAAATALERSARLSTDPALRMARLAAAADAAWGAGRAAAASALAAEVLGDATPPELRARVLRLRGAVEYFTGDASAAADALLEAVSLLETTDAAAAVSAAADAVMALVRARGPERALETAHIARALAPEDGSELDFEATATLGYALCFTGRYAEAEPHLRRAVALMASSTSVPTPFQAARLAATLAWLGRYEEGYGYMSRIVSRTRAVGAVGALAYLLAGTAWQAMHAGRWAEAEADAGEAYELAEQVGQTATAIQALGVLAWIHGLRGDDAGCLRYGEETRQRANEAGYRLYGLLVSGCFGVLHLGAGRIDAAIDELEVIARYADERQLRIPGIAPQLELAEALVRADRAEEAERLLVSFERSELVADPYLLAVSKRTRGLLAADDEFDARFEEAISLHAAIPNPFALARTRLCYGERLRRAGRRLDAREQLRGALDVFERLRAETWAERARAELRTSGEKLRRRDDSRGEELTPQELQIALHVAEGKTNKEVGAALFLSHKTIEFHLSRIYRKLDISSRAELVRRFAETGESGARAARARFSAVRESSAADFASA